MCLDLKKSRIDLLSFEGKNRAPPRVSPLFERLAPWRLNFFEKIRNFLRSIMDPHHADQGPPAGALMRAITFNL